MSTIFPGMDPYLEEPLLWPEVHNSMIVYLRDHLQPKVQPNYVWRVEERVYVEGTSREYVPDGTIRRVPERPPAPRRPAGGGSRRPRRDPGPREVREWYVTIRARRTGQEVVTVIEVLSPANKYAGPGRDSYLAKQRDVLNSPAHLVEVDLFARARTCSRSPNGPQADEALTITWSA